MVGATKLPVHVRVCVLDDSVMQPRRFGRGRALSRPDQVRARLSLEGESQRIRVTIPFARRSVLLTWAWFASRSVGNESNQ